MKGMDALARNSDIALRKIYSMSFAMPYLLCDFQKFPGTALVYDFRRARIVALLYLAIVSNLLLQFVNDFLWEEDKTDPYHWSINFEKWDWMKR